MHVRAARQANASQRQRGVRKRCGRPSDRTESVHVLDVRLRARRTVLIVKQGDGRRRRGAD
eukprot:9911659-Alexandrium_andersonii.AAC.1